MAVRKLVIAGVATLALAALVGGAAVVAQGGPGGGFGRHGGRGFMGPMAGLGQLGLSDDQRQQVHAALAGHRDEFKALSDRARKAHQDQQAAVEQVPMNEQQVRAAAAEVAAVEADMAVLHARVHEQVFSLLTPDQQAKAKQLAADRAARRAERRAEWQQRKQQAQPAAPQQ
jgi:Spy/CpxP family protein refolding chaperone